MEGRGSDGGRGRLYFCALLGLKVGQNEHNSKYRECMAFLVY